MAAASGSACHPGSAQPQRIRPRQPEERRPGVHGGVTGVFTAMDLFLFFIFWEIELIPMFLLIILWGGPRRVYAAWKFLLFTIAASALLLLAVLVLYFKSGAHTFDMQVLAGAHLAP